MPCIPIGDIQLNCEVDGEGTPLVLLHGLGGDLNYWAADAPVFAKHHRVVRPDLRGFGQTDKPAGPYSPGLFAGDVARLLDANRIEDAHVLGISMGGVIAQRLALDHPARVRSLVLVSTSSEVGASSIAAWQRLADKIERQGFDSASADARRSFSKGFAERHPEIVAELGRRNAACDPHGYAAAARAVADYNWTAELAMVTVPVLILQGLDDQLTPPGGSVKMSRVLPQARLLMIAEAGHNLPLEQPALFHNAVLAFLAGVDLTMSGIVRELRRHRK
ncbi:MAG TPA: alpha/beta fold hydrolase [Candidatus Acidoferrales bacterium]|nr:alpha/beta fold hydrolase [Candidatus Acidoferrales bacterium]